MTKYSRRGRGGGRAKFCKFLYPFHKFRTGVARNFKFGVRIDLGMSRLKYDIIPQRERGGSDPVAKFVNFIPRF